MRESRRGFLVFFRQSHKRLHASRFSPPFRQSATLSEDDAAGRSSTSLRGHHMPPRRCCAMRQFSAEKRHGRRPSAVRQKRRAIFADNSTGPKSSTKRTSDGAAFRNGKRGAPSSSRCPVAIRNDNLNHKFECSLHYFISAGYFSAR